MPPPFFSLGPTPDRLIREPGQTSSFGASGKFKLPNLQPAHESFPLITVLRQPSLSFAQVTSYLFAQLDLLRGLCVRIKLSVPLVYPVSSATPESNFGRGASHTVTKYLFIKKFPPNFSTKLIIIFRDANKNI